MTTELSRRHLLAGLAFLAVPASAASPIVVHRDPGCGCCAQWAALVQRGIGRPLRIVDDSRRAALQRQFDVPAELASCHTAIIDGLAFEGHVPIADIKRLLASRLRGVRGLAVPGMPAGSPGMEAPSAAPQHFVVTAFGSGSPVVYARH